VSDLDGMSSSNPRAAIQMLVDGQLTRNHALAALVQPGHDTGGLDLGIESRNQQIDAFGEHARNIRGRERPLPQI